MAKKRKRIRKQFSVEAPEELYNEVKVHCLLSGKTIREFTLGAVIERLGSKPFTYIADLKTVLMFLQGRGVAVVEPEGAQLEVDLSQGLVILPQDALAEGIWEPEEYLAQKVVLVNDKIVPYDPDEQGELPDTVLFVIKPIA